MKFNNQYLPTIYFILGFAVHMLFYELINTKPNPLPPKYVNAMPTNSTSAPTLQPAINTNTFKGITIQNCKKVLIDYQDCEWDKDGNKRHDAEDEFWGRK